MVVGQRFLEPIQIQKHHRANMQRVRLGRLDFELEIEEIERLGVPLFPVEDQPAEICGIDEARAQLQRLLQAQESLVRMVEVDQDRAEIFPKLGVFGRDGYGFFEGFERLSRSPRPLQHRSER